MRPRLLMLLSCCCWVALGCWSAAQDAPKADASGPASSQTLRPLVREARRIAFLGDSITAAGQYVAYFDAWLLTQSLAAPPAVIDAGLPSETVSGLSEDGHAGGKFPRPDLHERLARVLAAVRPDLVFACYGINCGIYQPFDDERFQRYQQGMRKLKQQVEQAGARLVVITPPFYDDQRSPKPFPYNAVLDRYSDWLVQQQSQGWIVIDLHRAMTQEVARRRTTDTQFTFQPDGVHPNGAGHWFVAQQLIRAMGDEASAAAATPEEMLRTHKCPEEALPLVVQRMQVLRDAYVHAAGHKRPGVATGLTVAAAEAKAAELSGQIRMLLSATNGGG